MAKKRNQNATSGNVLFNTDTEPNGSNARQPVDEVRAGEEVEQQSWWRGLGSGERIAAVAVCLLLVVGALGATGLGERIGAVFSSKSSTQKTNQSAQSFAAAATKNSSTLASLNPFAFDPIPTPQLSKEYIYAGSRMLAVEDAAASALPPVDLAVWRPSNGYWYVLGGAGSQQTFTQWGQSGDKTVPGDYDGDGKTDFAVFRNPNWYITLSSTNSFSGTILGNTGDTAVPADYDGDGKTDIAVYQNGTWAILYSSTGGSSGVTASFGQSGDIPIPADFDGDGKSDLAVWRVSGGLGYFYYLRSSMPGSASLSQQLGQSGDLPVVDDFDGDGKSDIAVYREATAGSSWYISYSANNYATYSTFAFGQTGDKLVSNDYDGDGKTDIAVWRDSTGTWYIRQSSLLGQSNEVRVVQWGQSGDTPVPAFYRR